MDTYLNDDSSLHLTVRQVFLFVIETFSEFSCMWDIEGKYCAVIQTSVLSSPSIFSCN